MKIPKAKKLPSGSWHIQLRLDGQSISVTEPTEQECIKKAQLLKAEYLAGKKPVRRDTSLTLDKLLVRYINAKKAVLSPSTVRGYEAIRRTRFLAYMDRDPAKINWQRMVSDEARLCGAKTLKNAWGLVSAALSFCGLQAPPVTLPRVMPDPHPFLDQEQIKVFLSAIYGTSVELAALLGLHGLRRSEMFALTWADIDRKRETITVRAAVVHDEDGKLVRKKETKNASSRRTVPIMIPRLLDLLDETGEDAQPKDPVLTCHPNSVYKAVNSICARENLPLIGVHGLRHSMASLCHSLGIPEAEVMSWGGWQNAQTMRKIYTHLDQTSRAKSADKLTAFFSDIS